jgi:hypothetical protein
MLIRQTCYYDKTIKKFCKDVTCREYMERVTIIRMTYGKSAFVIKCIHHLFLQLSIETYFAPNNIWRVMLEMGAGAHVECRLLMPEFNQNRRVYTNVSKTLQH